MPITCACRHSYTAHVAGSSKGCSFCSCVEFTDPAAAAAHKDAEPLSEHAQRALEMMHKHAAFRHVAPEHLQDLARNGHRRLFLAQAPVMVQGGESTSLHILVRGRGRVDRQVGSNVVYLAELGPGDIIGEMGVVSGEPRSATVTALEDMETLELEASFLKHIFHDDPDVLMAVMKVINERLRNAEAKIEASPNAALTHTSADA